MRSFAVQTLFLSLLFASPAAAADDREIVQVNGTPIRQSELFGRLWKRYGNETLDQMVDELLLRQAAQRAKIKVSEAEVERRLAKVREQFSDPKLLEAELANSGSSVPQLKEELREQISREKLIAAERTLSVTDGEVKKAFDARKDGLGQREAVRLRHILVASQQEAETAVAEVKSGKDFGQVAKERSLAPTGKINGGDYGFVAKGMLPADIEQFTFAMKPSELRILPSSKGFHVFQALERRAAAPAQYAKVKDDLRQELLQEKIKAVLSDYLRDLRAKADVKPAAN